MPLLVHFLFLLLRSSSHLSHSWSLWAVFARSQGEGTSGLDRSWIDYLIDRSSSYIAATLYCSWEEMTTFSCLLFELCCFLRAISVFDSSEGVFNFKLIWPSLLIDHLRGQREISTSSFWARNITRRLFLWVKAWIEIGKKRDDPPDLNRRTSISLSTSHFNMTFRKASSLTSRLDLSLLASALSHLSSIRFNVLTDTVECLLSFVCLLWRH